MHFCIAVLSCRLLMLQLLRTLQKRSVLWRVSKLPATCACRCLEKYWKRTVLSSTLPVSLTKKQKTTVRLVLAGAMYQGRPILFSLILSVKSTNGKCITPITFSENWEVTLERTVFCLCWISTKRIIISSSIYEIRIKHGSNSWWLLLFNAISLTLKI